jgi:hypothetical protein
VHLRASAVELAFLISCFLASAQQEEVVDAGMRRHDGEGTA